MTLAEHLERAFTGPMWHGPALAELVADVPPDVAMRRAIPGAHTIWEIVLHVTAWAEIVRARLRGERLDDPPEAENWPTVGEAGAAAWARARERLGDSYRALAREAAALDDATLRKTINAGGAEYTVAALLHGAIEHATYHGGQIAVLKKSGVGSL
jgi:uncharacterized damage-inducible protein DinB